MKNDDTYIEIKECIICIICLEELEEMDNNIKKICLNCNIKCHNTCLHKWYMNKKQKICPICLKTTKYYQKKYRNNTNIIQSNDEVVTTELGVEEESGLNDEEITIEEENVSEEILNYYLQQMNQGHSCYHYFMENNCTYRRKISYFLLLGITLYIYSNY